MINKRMCIACRNLKDRTELIRIVKYLNNIKIDSKSDGRGAYVCKNEECVNMCKKKKILDKVFKRSVEEAIYNQLSHNLK